MAGLFSYLVLGTGVGKAVATWLLKYGQAARVTLADNDYRRAEEAVRAVSPEEFKIERLMPGFFSTEHQDDPALRKMFERFDVVISAIPAKHNVRLAKIAIAAGTHLCDLGGVIEVTREMLELDTEAREKEVSIVPDCGLMPGLGNIVAQDLLRLIRGADDITIYVGGLPQRPQAPHYYQKIFSLEGLVHILNPAPILRDGNLLTVPAGAERESLHIPQLETFDTPFHGNIEAFISAGAGIAHEDFHRQGVRNFCEKTLRWPGFLDYVARIPPPELLETLERELPSTDANHPDLVFMRVVASRKDGKPLKGSWELFDVYDPITGLTAMQRTTGFSAAAMAYLAALHWVKCGVNPPEKAFSHGDASFYLGMLKDSLGLYLTRLA